MRLFARDVIGRFFAEEDLDKISGAIAEAEKQSAGEFRVKVIRRCDPRANGDILLQAKEEFVREGIAGTRDRTGILILISLEDKKFQILVDEGIKAKIPQWFFDAKAVAISAGFKSHAENQSKAHVDAICSTIRDLGVEVAKSFPRKPDDRNELPDDVVIGGPEQ